MSDDAKTAATPPEPPRLTPAPGALWNEFLRRNLLLASLAGAGVAAAASRAEAKGGSTGQGG